MLSRGLVKSRLIQSNWRQLIRLRSTNNNSTTNPPSYFSDHLESGGPKPLFSNDQMGSSPSSTFTPQQSLPQQPIPQPSSSTRFTSLRDLSVVLSIVALTYFAIDNYRTRTVLEAKILEQSMNHMKSLAIAQNNFNNQRRKRDAQLINERKNTQKREMKMVYHISMLRKQLVDSGMKPTEIDQAIEEFEKNVKMEYSLSNVSGTALWIVDDSPMKAYVPNIHDYDTKK